MSRSASPIRYGFLSTANIGRKNSWACKLSVGSKLVAVASRSLDSAQAFALENGFEKSYGSYQELLDDKSIDCIYMPLPTSLHVEWGVKAAKAGKHILCDKPCACSLEELDEIVEACKIAGVQFMDGVMFMHHSRLSRMRAILNDASMIAGVRMVTTAFSFQGDEHFFRPTTGNIRVNRSLEPLGCVGDLGWYNIRFTLWAFDWQQPSRVIALCHAMNDDVPLDVTFTMFWSDGRRATAHCSFVHAFRQWAEVLGPNGTLTLDDFVLPKSSHEASFSVVSHSRLVSMDRVVVGNRMSVNVSECNQEANMWSRMSALVSVSRSGGATDDFWPNVARKTQAVVDAVMKSLRSQGNAVDVQML